jgi:hypothetical protein
LIFFLPLVSGGYIGQPENINEGKKQQENTFTEIIRANLLQ